MSPWLQPIHDALDLLMRPSRPLGLKRKKAKNTDVQQGPAKKPYEVLMEQGVIEIEALCYIRGRSIPNRFFILDEAQQLTPQEAKTIVTRMSQDSKLVGPEECAGAGFYRVLERNLPSWNCKNSLTNSSVSCNIRP